MKRKMMKKFTVVSLAVCICLFYAGAVDAKPFSDVNENDWFYYAVTMVEDVGYMNEMCIRDRYDIVIGRLIILDILQIVQRLAEILKLFHKALFRPSQYF